MFVVNDDISSVVICGDVSPVIRCTVSGVVKIGAAAALNASAADTVFNSVYPNCGPRSGSVLMVGTLEMSIAVVNAATVVTISSAGVASMMTLVDTSLIGSAMDDGV
jgi:hypothetical protein